MNCSLGNVKFAMQEYGKFRTADIYKEHRHQCESLEMIIEIFRNGESLYWIGFITLRNDEYNKALGLTRYEDDPYWFSE